MFGGNAMQLVLHWHLILFNNTDIYIYIYSIEAPRSMNTHTEGNPDPNNLDLDVPFLNPDDTPTSGVVMESNGAGNHGDTSLWNLNVVLALVSCWVAASLTGWGTIQVALIRMVMVVGSILRLIPWWDGGIWQ